MSAPSDKNPVELLSEQQMRAATRTAFISGSDRHAKAIATSVASLEALFPVGDHRSWRSWFQEKSKEALFTLGAAIVAVHELARSSGALGMKNDLSRAARLLHVGGQALRLGTRPKHWHGRHVDVPSDAPTTVPSWVYFIQQSCTCSVGPIKIGVASDPFARLADLQIANPHPLALVGLLPGTQKFERELHGRFAADRLAGEWFHASAELVAFIASINEEGPST